jgi:hypothetical protein
MGESFQFYQMSPKGLSVNEQAKAGSSPICLKLLSLFSHPPFPVFFFGNFAHHPSSLTLFPAFDL